MFITEDFELILIDNPLLLHTTIHTTTHYIHNPSSEHVLETVELRLPLPCLPGTLSFRQFQKQLPLLWSHTLGDLHPGYYHMVPLGRRKGTDLVNPLNYPTLTSCFIVIFYPSWHPDGITISLTPRRVFTLILHPSTAWEIFRNSVDSKSFPLLLNLSWGFTSKLTCRSPASPFSPLFPFYFIETDSPCSAPAGTSIASSTVDLMVPVALQVPQGSLIINPLPLHFWQGRCITIDPCLKVVVPDPPQDMHRTGTVPGLHLFPLQVAQVPTF